jgi:hypothetical protein
VRRDVSTPSEDERVGRERVRRLFDGVGEVVDGITAAPQRRHGPEREVVRVPPS